jgi:hypothetical protein
MIVDKKMIAERKLLYGNNFPKFAELINNYLSNFKNEEEPIFPEDVAVMMMLMKVSRLLESPMNEDTLTDLLNYAWIATSYKEYEKIGKDVDKIDDFKIVNISGLNTTLQKMEV